MTWLLYQYIKSFVVIVFDLVYFVWYIFFHSFTFNLLVFLDLKWPLDSIHDLALGRRLLKRDSKNTIYKLWEEIDKLDLIKI